MKPTFLQSAFLAVALVVALPGTGRAIVDDAHSFAMGAAVPYVEKGFRVRSDYWSGEIRVGERKAIRHQLFRGNDYCFWLGADADGVALEIGIYDLDGNAMDIQVVDSNHATSARILPPSTGSYYIVFSIRPIVEAIDPAEGDTAAEAKEEAEADAEEKGLIGWALAYGYR